MYQIQEKMDEALSAIKLVQDVNDRNSKRLDALDAEQIKKASDDVCKALEAVNDLQGKQKALDEQNARLEKLICGMNTSSKAQYNEGEDVARNDFLRYLRKGIGLPEKTLEHISESIMKKYFFGLTDHDRQLLKKDLQVQVDPDGGYWVRPELLAQTITRVFETSPVRQYANVITTNTDAVEMIIDDEEPTSGWVGETESRPNTNTPQIGLLKIYVHELYANPRATQKMIDDAGFDIEAWLQGKIVRKFTRQENTAFVNGDGNKKPRGFLTYPAWASNGVYEKQKVEQLTSASSLALEGDDVKKLQNLLLEDYQPTAVWFMNRTTFGTVTRLKDGEDRYLLDPNSFKVGDTKILLGSQVVFMHDLQAAALDDSFPANSLPIVYGDLNIGYTVVDRIGIRVLRDPYSAKPYIQYYTTKRVGGDVTSYDSFKILKIKA